MEPDILKIATEVRDTIIKARTYRTAAQVDELFYDAEGIIASLAFLTGPKAELEQAYRRLIVADIDKGKSVAEAKARAQASDEYKWFRKIEAVYLLGEEQIKLLKRFKEDLAAEFKRTV